MNKHQISFRPAQLVDQPAIKQLHKLALGEHFKPGYPDEDLNDIYMAYVAKDGEFYVGYHHELLVVMGGFRRFDERTAELKRMRVHPEWQGIGLGRKLLNRLEIEIADRKYQAIALDTQPTQIAAVRLYESAGYEQFVPEAHTLPEGAVFYHKTLEPSA